MYRGQPFKILEESNWGPMGTRVGKIKLLNDPLPTIGYSTQAYQLGR